MRTSNIKVTIDMPLPTGVPDGNGFVYTREAIREAVRTMGGVPLTWKDEIIGFVDAGYIASEGEKKSVLRMHATIPFGGTSDDCVAFDSENLNIDKYHITGVAFCE